MAKRKTTDKELQRFSDMFFKWKRPSLKDKHERAFQDVGDLTFNAKARRCVIRGGRVGSGYTEKVPCKAVLVDGTATGPIISDSMGSVFTFKGSTLCLLGRKGKKDVVECARERR